MLSSFVEAVLKTLKPNTLNSISHKPNKNQGIVLRVWSLEHLGNPRSNLIKKLVFLTLKLVELPCLSFRLIPTWCRLVA